jgi:hypothetical protein
MVMSKKWKEAASLILTVAGPLAAQPIGKKPLAALGQSASSHARQPPPL